MGDDPATSVIDGTMMNHRLRDLLVIRTTVFATNKLAQGYQIATSIAAGQPALRIVSEEDRVVLERCARRVLGAFFEKTDVGWRQSNDDPVPFLADAGCNNPFASLT